jgi:hypothetical protein
VVPFNCVLALLLVRQVKTSNAVKCSYISFGTVVEVLLTAEMSIKQIKRTFAPKQAQSTIPIMDAKRIVEVG